MSIRLAADVFPGGKHPLWWWTPTIRELFPDTVIMWMQCGNHVIAWKHQTLYPICPTQGAPSVLAACLGSRALPQVTDTENKPSFQESPCPYKTFK